MSSSLLLTEALASNLKITIAAQLRSALERGALDAALQKLSGTRYAGASATWSSRLAHVPGAPDQLVSLARNLENPSLRRGLMGELNTGVFLESYGIRVHEMSCDVFLAGRKYTDLDLLTEKGSLVEVKDFASNVHLSDIRDKADRMCLLRDVGVEVNGVRIERLYFYAPGGISDAARAHLQARGIEVLISKAELAKVV